MNSIKNVGIWCLEDASKQAVTAVRLDPETNRDQTVTWEQLRALHEAGFDLLLRHTGHGPSLIVSTDVKRNVGRLVKEWAA